jgi:hypothetical protein
MWIGRSFSSSMVAICYSSATFSFRACTFSNKPTLLMAIVA